MPFAFPSHQGLIAPLWRRWPAFFDTPALFISAAMPDVVDGIIGAFRGHLGQGLGHSLVALPLLCIPGGMMLWWLAHYMAQRLPYIRHGDFVSRSWNTGLESLLTAPGPGSGKVNWAIVVLSLGIGSFSHLLIDLISHGSFVWLYPWVPKGRLFPDWWHVKWMHLSIPGYRNPYPIGPHFIVWMGLSLLGIYLLFVPIYRDRFRGKYEDKDISQAP